MLNLSNNPEYTHPLIISELSIFPVPVLQDLTMGSPPPLNYVYYSKNRIQFVQADGQNCWKGIYFSTLAHSVHLSENASWANF